MIAHSFHRRHLIAAALLFTCALKLCGQADSATTKKPWDNGRLVVDSTSRALAHQNGRPFFWMGDSCWEFFHRSTREEVDRYLADRAENRFNVIQAVAVAEFGGLDVPNYYGHLPFERTSVYPRGDMGVPRVRPGENDDYWNHVNFIIDRAAHYGIYVCYVVTWATYITPARAVDEHNAHAFGAFIGRSLRDKPNVIYMLGCDRDAEVDGVDYRPVWRLMAQGIKDNDPNHLMSFLTKYQDARYWFEGESWLDFNMIQYRMPADTWDVHNLVSSAYAKKPAMPAINVECNLDGDGFYHGSSVGAALCRREFYWYVFFGAFGHTYGHLALITWWNTERPYRVWFNPPAMSWHQAIDSAGAREKKFARNLMESRPLSGRSPEPALIAFGQSDKTEHLEACRGEGYAYVFSPTGKNFGVTLGLISGEVTRAWWFNPRNGEATQIATFPNRGSRTFNPPGEPALGNDWILVLDDAARSFPAPGSRDDPQEPRASAIITAQATQVGTSGASRPPGGELLDGDFENQSAEWSLNQASFVDRGGKDDGRALRMQVGDWATAEQRIPAEPNRRFVVAGGIRTAATTVPVGIVAIFRNRDGREIGRRAVAAVQGTQTYAVHRAEMVSPADTASLDVRLYSSDGGTGEVVFDELSVRVLP